MVSRSSCQKGEAFVTSPETGLNLPGYRITGLIRKSPRTTVFEGVREKDRRPIIAKVYTAMTGKSATAHFQYEYRLLSTLDVPGTARALDFLRAGELQVLILERFPGIDPRRLVADRPDLETFLILACRITRILAGVHARRIVHRDVKPTSILVDPDTLEVCLADFGISIALEKSHRQIYDPGVLQGTLPYISPEQTGRTARGVDHRSDLYSLGVTFYELLAGRRPFEEEDPLALVHAHLARQATPLSDALPHVPEVLSAIVERLMVKDPAERYQSGRSLLEDLRRCRTGLDGAKIEPFVIATADPPATPQFTSKLYGRAAELEELFAAFDRTLEGGVEWLLIRGPAGIGKTALVREIQRPLTARGGYLAAGKFELHRRDVPLLAWRQALEALAEELLVEDDASLERWTKRISGSVGSLGGVLLELSPKLERLLGPRPVLAELESRESRNRLFLAVSRLLGAIASPEHPLVLFLDDLQWCDPGSLELLEYLAIQSETEGLLLISADRPGEHASRFPAADPLGDVLERWPAKGREPLALELGPLSPNAGAELIRDALGAGFTPSHELAVALAGRTENNPLLIRQSLLFLADEGLLERGAEGWSWSLQAVRSAGIPEDAVGVIQAKVARLPDELRTLLAAASCLGSRFDLPTLAVALDREPVDILPGLDALEEEGLLAASGSSEYRFSHDRIEEAAGRGIEPGLARTYHRRVGLFLRQATPAEDLAEHVFTIVKHLNWILTDAEDRAFLIDLARLNHLAGTKAVASAAHAAAERYLATGLEALERARDRPPSETVPGELYLTLAIDHARSIALAGHHEKAERLFDELMGESHEALERGRICGARVEISALRGDFDAACRWGLEGLAHCGLRLPRHPSRLRLALRLAAFKRAFRGNVAARLQALPPCTEARALMRVELFSRLVIPSFISGNRLYRTVILEHALQLRRHGRSPRSAYPLVVAGALMGSVLGDHETAKEIAAVGREMSRGSTSSGRTIMGINHSVYPWVKPYRECLAELEEAFDTSLEEGDFEFAGLTRVACTTFSAVGGIHLETVIKAARQARSYRADRGLVDQFNRQRGLLQVCETLVGKSPGPREEEAGEQADDRALSPSEILWRMVLAVIANQPRRAFELSEIISDEADGYFFSTHYLGEYVFFRGLAAAGCHEATGFRRGRSWKALVQAHRLERRWAEHCAANFAAKALVLEAERARLRGRNFSALRLYERAAESAAEHRLHHVHALVLERLGRFARRQGWATVAQAVFSRCRECYAAWGALAKVEWLQAELGVELGEAAPSHPGHASESSSTRGDTLDLGSVLKTSRAISEEIRLDALIGRLLAAAIENAGAQRGLLLLASADEDSGSLGVVAEAAVGEEPRRHEPALDPEACVDRLALPVLRLTVRTAEPVILADAAADRRFASSSYVKALKPRSIACLPILKQGRVSGVLYLENSLAAGAFTAERAEVLQVLSAQAAISLENARLYENLRETRDRLEVEIEEHLRINEKRRELVAQLRAKTHELERFTYAFSHDLKTPLVTITNFLGRLRRDLEESQGESFEAHLQAIEESAGRMYRLLDGLLEFIDAGRVEPEPEPIELEGLIARVLRSFRGTITEQGVEVKVVRPMPMVVIDRKRFSTVFEHLLDNSLRFMGQQERPVIEITAGETEEKVRIEIADNGMGVDAAYHERVFDLFEQLKASSRGIGLGLALVKRIVEAHGGRVRVESEGRDRGSRFTLELPHRRAAIEE